MFLILEKGASETYQIHLNYNFIQSVSFLNHIIKTNTLNLKQCYFTYTDEFINFFHF